MLTITHIQDQIAFYKENGYLFPIEALSEIDTIRYRSQFEELEKHYDHHLPWLGNIHHHFQWAYELATQPNITNLVKEILGPEICVMSTLMLTKYPHTEAHVNWHQDGHDSGWNPNHSVTAWVALSDSTPENGCMKVVPQSHHTTDFNHHSMEDENSMTRNNFIIQWEEEPKKVQCLELEAGKMSLHHNNIAHSSDANQSSTKRIGFIIRFGTPQTVAKNKTVVLIDPQMEYKDLTHLKCPASPNLNNKEAIERLKENLLTHRNRK